MLRSSFNPSRCPARHRRYASFNASRRLARRSICQEAMRLCIVEKLDEKWRRFSEGYARTETDNDSRYCAAVHLYYQLSLSVT